MGQEYFKSIYYQHRGEMLEDDHREDIDVSSEDLGMMIDNQSEEGRKVQRMLGCKAGIFYYESNTWDIPELKKRLHALVDEIE